MARDQSLEVWENVTAALLGLRKIDHRGNEKDALVRGGAKVTMTPEERELNESLVIEEKFNPFRNGMLRAVRLTDSPDAGEVDSSAALSAEEMAALFKKAPTVFIKSVKEIGSSILLQRLITFGEENDGTVRQIEALRERLESVEPLLTRIPVEVPGF